MLTDFVQARAARTRGRSARSTRTGRERVVYCSITAALLWPRPGAMWLDTIAAENRPGRHGIWQRVVERRRLREAPLVLTMSERSLAPLTVRPHAETVRRAGARSSRSGPAAASATCVALTYAGNPREEAPRLRARRVVAGPRADDEQLVVAGIDAPDGRPEGVQARRPAAAGRVPRAAAARAGVRRRAAPRGLRDRAARGAGRRLRARDDAGAGPVSGARARPPARPAARRRRPRRCDPDRARRPAPGYAERAARAARRRSAARPSTRPIAEHVLPRLLPR